jgi:hypothetical protein
LYTPNDIYYDIDGLDLFSQLILTKILHIEESALIDTLNYIKRFDSFPNTSIAYKSLRTIPVTVASTEINFSKLKLIKSYLRLTISQERLNELAILSIEKQTPENFFKFKWIKSDHITNDQTYALGSI